MINPTSKRHCAVWMGLAVAIVLAPAGCSWRPASEALRPAPGMRVQVSGRLAPIGSRLVYHRSDPTEKGPTPTPQSYEVVVADSHRIEGDLIGAEIARIEPYLQKKKQPLPDALRWPPTTQEAWAFYLAFDPPLGACPSTLVGEQSTTCKSRATFFNWQGKKLGAGTATRQFLFEGYEDVTVSEKAYTDCVRLAVETIYDGSWSGKVKTTDYLWLAPRIGAVRRIQVIAGRLLARPLNSKTQWDLISIQPGSGAKAGGSYLGQWQRVAVRLSPAGSHPRLSGLVIENDSSKSELKSNGSTMIHD